MKNKLERLINYEKKPVKYLVKEWDNFRGEAMNNMFHQFKYGSMNAFQEATKTYRNAIDIHTGLYLINIV